MKRLILIIFGMMALQNLSMAQDNYGQQIQADVTKLDLAKTIGDYQELANDFSILADYKKTDWLGYYYAAFCNAKIGWMYMQSPDKITPFANIADQQIKSALSLMDTTNDKKDLSEIYCVFSMVYRAKVYINPMTNGRKYGPAASQYCHRASQLEPQNPRALYLLGWEKYNTPKLWGGDKTKAKELLESALKKLSSSSSSGTNPHWGKKECEEILSKYN